MIPLLKKFAWSLLWDAAWAGRLVRAVSHGAIAGAIPSVSSAIDGKALSARALGLSIGLGALGALAGWIRGGEPNAPAAQP